MIVDDDDYRTPQQILFSNHPATATKAITNKCDTKYGDLAEQFGNTHEKNGEIRRECRELFYRCIEYLPLRDCISHTLPVEQSDIRK